MNTHAQQIVKQAGGDWHGSYGLCPGPGHSRADRSLKVFIGDDGRIRCHSFSGDDWRECRAHLGLDGDGWKSTQRKNMPLRPSSSKPADVPLRVREMLKTSTRPDLVPDVVQYLDRRHLWPLPPGCTLKAHPAAEYWTRTEDGSPRMLGRFPALIGEVRNINGVLVTAHVTFLKNGRKLEGDAPRKIMSGMAGHDGCAVRLLPVNGGALGIAEGVETAIAAHRLSGIPTWAALNAGQVSAFTPPSGVEALTIFADGDPAGLKAAWQLRDRLPTMKMVLWTPKRGDAADDWAARHV